MIKSIKKDQDFSRGGLGMKQLIVEYKQSLKVARNLQRTTTDEREKSIIGGMIRDLEYSIEWLSKGHTPGHKRGAERLAAYQREKPFDPILMQKYFRSLAEDTYEWDDHQKEHLVTEIDNERIEDALSVLSKVEKEIYLMSRGYCLSYGSIANLLGISKSTVQTAIERSETKINNRIYSSLFCLPE
jgi:RNA polymerase sigma factor (sigma-70 family)